MWLVHTMCAWMSHVKHMMWMIPTRRDSFILEWRDSCLYVSQFMSHVTRMNESCQTYEWVMSHIWMRDVIHAYVTWLSSTWRDVFLCDVTDFCVTWLIPNRRDSFARHVTRFYVTWLTLRWLILVWCHTFLSDVTHSYVTWLNSTWRDSFLCDVTHFCLMSLNLKWRDSFIRHVTQFYVTWLILMWRDAFLFDVTHSYVMRRTTFSHVTHKWVTTHTNESCHFLIRHLTYECVWCDALLRDVTYSSVTWHLSVTWLIPTWRDSFLRDVTHSYVMRLIPTRRNQRSRRSALHLPRRCRSVCVHIRLRN